MMCKCVSVLLWSWFGCCVSLRLAFLYYFGLILRSRWPNRITNQELLQQTKQVPITTTIKQRKWRWIGHTLRRSQTNIVNGNLEVTNLISPNMTFDLSFLSTIKVVTGYVLLGHLNTDVISLTSLRLIRADRRMKVADGWYSLIVVLTSLYPHNPTPGLTELRIPKLTEISQGSVLFWWNPYLCFVDTIGWSLITPGTVEMKTEAHSKHCGKCHPGCEKDGGVRRCWGAGRHMCQTLPKLQCDPSCRGKCFREGRGGCCDKACAVGCYGNLDTECKMCKYFRYGHRCIRHCPAETYPLAQRCIDF